MSYIIDRRLDGKNKSTVNRSRFIRRYKSQLKRSVVDVVNRRSITDMGSGEKVGIPSRDISEPIFRQGHGGIEEIVHTGNKEFSKGDRIPRPKGGGGGSGQGSASNSGQGEDDFVFELSREEFMDLLFDDLELPNLVRNQLVGTTEFKPVRAGYRTDGAPGNIDVVRSLKGAIARRTAIGAPHRARVRELEEEIDVLLTAGVEQDDARILEMREEIERLQARITALPFIDTFDLRYQAFIQQPKPTSKAVMLCIMDVSGSMGEVRKNLAKRFFMLLYFFLQRNYEKIDVVFIRHHTIAQEVEEQEFFYSTESGGTIVSRALELAYDIVRKRYDPSAWNVYCAQASDGDNQGGDSIRCGEVLNTALLPLLRYFAYVEIAPTRHQALWFSYENVKAVHKHFAMQQIDGVQDIYPVFQELFQRQTA